MSQEDRLTGLVGYSGMKVPVIAATTAAITLSGEQTIDGIACVTDDRVLVKDQASAVNNGIYVVDTGSWSRAPDADGPFDFVFGTLIPVASGSVNGGAVFRLTTTGEITPGTSSLSFSTMGLLATPVPIASGGTGASTVPTAQANLLIGTQSTVASSATPDIWTGTGTQIDFTGSTGPVTGFAAAPRAGIWRVLVCASTPSFTHGANLLLPGSANYTAAAGDIIVVYALSTTQFRLNIFKADGTAVVVAASTIPLPTAYLSGCKISNNSGDATNDIDIAAGKCRNAADTANITVAALTKRLDANWAAGTNQGMRNSAAAIADGTYHIYAVSTAAGTQDIYAYAGVAGTDPDTSSAEATVIAALQLESGGSSYLYARRIGSILRVSNAIIAFQQTGDEFLRNDAGILDVSVTNQGNSAVDRTLSVPMGLKVDAIINAIATDATGGAEAATYIKDKDISDQAASSTAAPLCTIISSQAAGFGGGSVRVRTSRSGVVTSRAVEASAATLRIATMGWIDRRGRDG